jgi:hypothetical protein
MKNMFSAFVKRCPSYNPTVKDINPFGFQGLSGDTESPHTHWDELEKTSFHVFLRTQAPEGSPDLDRTFLLLMYLMCSFSWYIRRKGALGKGTRNGKMLFLLLNNSLFILFINFHKLFRVLSFIYKFFIFKITLFNAI